MTENFPKTTKTYQQNEEKGSRTPAYCVQKISTAAELGPAVLSRMFVPQDGAMLPLRNQKQHFKAPVTQAERLAGNHREKLFTDQLQVVAVKLTAKPQSCRPKDWSVTPGNHQSLEKSE